MKFRPERNEAARCWTVEGGELHNYLPLDENLELVLGGNEDAESIRLDSHDPPAWALETAQDDEMRNYAYIQRAVATVIEPRDPRKKSFLVLSRRANGHITTLIRAKAVEVIGSSAKILVEKEHDKQREALVQLPGIVKITEEARVLYLTAIHKGTSTYEGPKLHTENGYEKYRARLLTKGLDLEKTY